MNQTVEMTLVGSVVSGQPVCFITYYGSCLPSSCRLANGIDPVAGIALDDGDDGEVVTVQFEGNVETLRDNLVTGTGYYALANGVLTAVVGNADQFVGAACTHSAITLGIAHKDLQIAVGPEDLTASATPSGGQVPTASTDTKSFVWTTNVTTDEKVSIDAAATPGYIGATSGDGVLRTSAPLSWTDGGDFATIGVAVPVVHTLSDAGTTNAPTVQTIKHLSSGLAAAGFGSAIALGGQNSVAAPAQEITLATIAGVITDPADGTEDADLVISTMRAGSVVESARVTSVGALTTVGAISGSSLAATGAITGGSAVSVTTTDAGTTNAPPVATFVHRSSGLAAAGFGVGIDLIGQNSEATPEPITLATIEGVITDPANATEDADLVFKTMRAGTVTESARISSVGTLSTIGLSVTGNTQFGDASTDTVTCVGRLIVRTVTDAGPMTATAGTLAEVVYNTSDSGFYGCTVAGSTATWVKLG
jgi:hypothetical protein